MDILYDATIYYKNNLLNKIFHFKAERKNKIIEFDVYFGIEHFKHLIGFQHVNDIVDSSMSSIRIYNDILNKNITNSKLQKSHNYNKIYDRIKNFIYICDVLFSKELLFKSLHGSFLNVKADFTIKKEFEGIGIVQLFLKKKSESIAIPISFFLPKNDRYFQNTVKWKIIDVYEVEK